MVEKKWLIVLNCLLWAAAGINILRIGVKAALSAHTWVFLWSIPVFVAFGLMFRRVIRKNTMRIRQMDRERAPICMFLTWKGYAIITFMMTLGIVLRTQTSLPDSFFAYFYTGLGLALSFTGTLSLFKTH